MLSYETAKWPMKFRYPLSATTETEPLRDDLAELRVGKEYYDSPPSGSVTLTAAFKLADRSLLTVAGDDTVAGMERTVDKVIQNYTLLSDEPETPATRTTSVPDGMKEGSAQLAARPEGRLRHLPP